MREKSFSIVNFCQNLVGCRRRKGKTKRYDEFTAKTIMERILRRKSFSGGKLCADKRRLSKSSPNLSSQVNGNLTLKPTISIKRDNSDYLHRDHNSFCRKEKLFNFSVLESDRKFPNDQQWNQQNPTTNSHHKKHTSFKHKNKNLVPNLTSQNKLFISKNFKSCPNINQYCIQSLEKLDSLENLMIDNIDDFTTNLFLDDFVIDESNIDLVSIKLDFL